MDAILIKISGWTCRRIIYRSDLCGVVVSNSDNSDGDISTYCSQTFNAFDKWLIRLANENNSDEAFKIAKGTFQNNVKANIDYYEYVAKSAEEEHLEQVATRNHMIANMYRGFLTG
jgi:hypothetical protein